MHECERCYMACYCDGDDTYQPQPANCTHDGRCCDEEEDGTDRGEGENVDDPMPVRTCADCPNYALDGFAYCETCRAERAEARLAR